ncbi:MAG: FAD-dependent oxidoreductase [Ignavibacteriales bacterium]|nr:FAD-dependent oxidoreductase [Ignavibacteriales bacterium]
MTYDVAIIGGGVAGLSATVDLCARGKRVILLEQKQRFGGRTYSFIDRTTGSVVDNGQHLLMGCYHATRTYLRTIGSDHLAVLQPTLEIPFFRPQHPPTVLRCLPLIAPLHLVSGLVRLSSLSPQDRLRLIRLGLDLLTTSPQKRQRLAKQTAAEWLDSLGQSEEARKHLWDVIAIGSLNDDPSIVSAALFRNVLRAAFLGKRENASLLIPRVGLSELLVDPALSFIGNHGGSVRAGATVKRLSISRDGINGVVLDSEEQIRSSFVISAVPWHNAHRVVRGVVSSEWQNSTIISINLWFDREVMTDAFAALLDCSIHWVFNRSSLLPSTGHAGERKHQHLSVVISGAASFAAMSTQQLVRLALDDLRRVLPGVQRATLVHSLVMKEKRATFSPRPEAEPYRPTTATRFPNLFLAGDWTDTGFPATIEGAALSGHRAAEAILALR